MCCVRMWIWLYYKKHIQRINILFVCYCWCWDVDWMNFVASTGAMTLHLFACWQGNTHRLYVVQVTEYTQEREWNKKRKYCDDKYTHPIYLLKRVCYIVFVTTTTTTTKTAINAHFVDMWYYCVFPSTPIYNFDLYFISFGPFDCKFMYHFFFFFTKHTETINYALRIFPAHPLSIIIIEITQYPIQLFILIRNDIIIAIANSSVWHVVKHRFTGKRCRCTAAIELVLFLANIGSR